MTAERPPHHLILRLEDIAGQVMRFEELACQRWAEGLIVAEQFSDDPGPSRPRAT